eukprot:CAMPEP_0206373608 /NCGR_PEP_ID=MMETSP0294-20121207/7818_1 /ASSEMBLY_ACC=CAM_ASM_000327 /TAXON_ID=39354 /ORGANISM="Heterosigma akashiwo, Strain CCMP2393" /LENGTH=113 /DNA_ID=CAMNT_0053821235 /DNA_START=696 /DNA_END=1037 /DNA_ORIENTATION=-
MENEPLEEHSAGKVPLALHRVVGGEGRLVQVLEGGVRVLVPQHDLQVPEVQAEHLGDLVHVQVVGHRVEHVLAVLVARQQVGRRAHHLIASLRWRRLVVEEILPAELFLHVIH